MNLKSLQSQPVSYKGETPETEFLREVADCLQTPRKPTRQRSELMKPRKNQKGFFRVITKSLLDKHPIKPSVPQMVDYVDDAKRSQADHDSMIEMMAENWAAGRDIYSGEQLAPGVTTEQSRRCEVEESKDFDVMGALLGAFQTFGEKHVDA